MNILDLVREDLRDFAGYSSARRSGGGGPVWLNANESPWRNPAEAETRHPGCNRYPEPQPARLCAALAGLYGVTPSQVLVGRGSDEAIDLLVRALCRPQRDAVLVSPPVFGMYAVCARLQAAPLVEVPLHDGADGFSTDIEAVATAALARDARLVFLCSPANPTGQALALEEISLLADRLEGRAIVVVDEAYVEYSAQPSAVSLLASRPNLAVLRTLSKAHALAAARIGTLIADPQLITVLRNCQAPYPLPTPCVQLALDALLPQALATTALRVQSIRAQRQRLFDALPQCAGVRRVYPSQGNYLLVRFDDAGATHRRLLDAGVVVRDMRSAPQLDDALRISVGSAEENDVLLATLQGRRAVA